MRIAKPTKTTHIRIGGNNKVTHTRVYKDTVADFNREMPGVRHADIIKMSWQQYQTIQKMGKFIYGDIWKRAKKK